MQFDYTELKKRIPTRFKSLREFGEAINISKTVLFNKLHFGDGFTQPQIVRIIKLLDLDTYETARFFFTPMKEQEECERLKKLICAKYGSCAAFAETIGLEYTTLNKKLKGCRPFNANDVSTISAILGIPSEDTQKYFYPAREKANKRKELKNGHNN